MDVRDCLLKGTSTLVVKIGSSLLVDADGQPRAEWMRRLASGLSARPGPVIVVSSGAIGLGRGRLGLSGRPAELAEAQAAAAIGQIELARAWTEAWAACGRTAAQLLLTLGDLEHRARYLNARNTIETLLRHRAVPIVNENDTVATAEIRFGDNDRLAARTALLAGAELLLLLSDVDGLHEADPAIDPESPLLRTVSRVDARIESLAGGAEDTGFGTGGMVSKIAAARIATDGGCPVLLAGGSGEDDPVRRYCETGLGTLFEASDKPLARRKQWLRSLQHRTGTLHIDDGAVAALKRGASLLASGVRRIEGTFARGDLVALQGPDGRVGQGLAGYCRDDAARIAGHPSSEHESLLGYGGRGPVVHRNDLVLFS